MSGQKPQPHSGVKWPADCAQAPGVTLALGWHFRPQGRGEDGGLPKGTVMPGVAHGRKWLSLNQKPDF